MRCLVISDIHANLPALQAVFADVKTQAQPYDIVWCLGDVVGYGAEPNECIDLLRTVPHICLAGNHDWAVIGKLDLRTFHEQAAYHQAAQAASQAEKAYRRVLHLTQRYHA